MHKTENNKRMTPDTVYNPMTGRGGVEVCGPPPELKITNLISLKVIGFVLLKSKYDVQNVSVPLSCCITINLFKSR